MSWMLTPSTYTSQNFFKSLNTTLGVVDGTIKACCRELPIKDPTVATVAKSAFIEASEWAETVAHKNSNAFFAVKVAGATVLSFRLREALPNFALTYLLGRTAVHCLHLYTNGEMPERHPEVTRIFDIGLRFLPAGIFAQNKWYFLGTNILLNATLGRLLDKVEGGALNSLHYYQANFPEIGMLALRKIYQGAQVRPEAPTVLLGAVAAYGASQLLSNQVNIAEYLLRLGISGGIGGAICHSTLKTKVSTAVSLCAPASASLLRETFNLLTKVPVEGLLTLGFTIGSAGLFYKGLLVWRNKLLNETEVNLSETEKWTLFKSKLTVEALSSVTA
jgi:hypothetical protein